MILKHALLPPDNKRLAHLCGSLDEHLRTIELGLGVKLSRRQELFRIEGPKAAAERTQALLDTLYERARRTITPEQLQLAVTEAAGDVARAAAPPKARRANAAAKGAQPAATPAPGEPLVLRTRRADLAGRTPRQHEYLRNILGHDITFGLGPAGTGKTFLAVACAVDALERSAVQRIILTRPAVEAGERLGFLPGDLTQKVDPYLRPLYDALYDLMGFDRVAKAFEKGLLEVAPLAFMRGRTLNHAFVILDEAQNTTPEQMKMFLTRIGFGSRAVVTGDVTQIDLAKHQKSGLIDAQNVLKDVRGIALHYFKSDDVVRHPLVQKIVDAYDKRDRAQKAERDKPSSEGNAA